MAIGTAVLAGVAVAGTVAGAAVSIHGQNAAADAANKAGAATAQASKDQLAFEERWAQLQLQERRRVEQQGVAYALQYGKKSPEEMAATARLLTTKQQGLTAGLDALQREYQVYDQMDATVKEAGQQQLQLLKGQQAKILSPLLAQRDKQKQQVEAQLAAKLGPGFRTSSAGIEALTKFDAATDTLMAGAQQDALNQVSNIMTTAAAARPNVLAEGQSIFQQAAGIDQAVSTAESNATSRMMTGVLSGFKQTPLDLGGLFSASNQVTQTAGAPFAGDVMQGQGQQQLGGQLIGVGTNAGSTLLSNAMFSQMFQNLKPPTSNSPSQAPAPTFGSVMGRQNNNGGYN